MALGKCGLITRNCLKKRCIKETKKSSRTDSWTTTFGLKRDMNIGFWNVRTLYQTGKLKQLATEAERYRVDILGVSEVRWNEFGEMRTLSGQTFLYSGKPNEDDPHQEGVGLLLSRRVVSGLLDWRPISSRIIIARFKGKIRNVSVVQCYAPTEEAEADKKAKFYSELQTTMQAINKRDIVIVMGDFNAKVGAENLGLEQVMGQHGLGVMNENGELLVDFCASNELVIGGTLFPHKECHKVTWVSPDLRTESQIDHLAISRSWRRSLLDVRNRRGADISSDHHLVTARIRIKIAAAKKRFEQQRKRFDVGKLQNERNKEQFKINLSNRCAALQVDEDDVEEHWERIKNTLTDTAEEVLGFRNTRRKEWMSTNTWECIEQRRELKLKLNNWRTRNQKVELQAAYHAKDREVKKNAKADRKKWVADLAESAETAARERNMKGLYDITRKLARKKFKQNRPIKSKQGDVITNDEAKLNRWREHFMEVLNREDVEKDGQVAYVNEDGETDGINTEPPSRKEIKEAIRQMRNGKAPGVDNIAPELLTVDPDMTADLLHPLFTKIWSEEKMPKEWREGLLVKIPKKGDLTNCHNWRGITLLSIPSKVMTRVILNRIKTRIEKQLRKEQAGFRSNRSCIDQINTLRIIIEQFNEYNAGLCLLFVDFEKAFDSLERNTMWRALQKYGIPMKIGKIIKQTYDDFIYRVVHEGKLSEPFTVNAGVRQGCVLSPTVFLLVLDDVMRKVVEGRRRGIQWGLVERLESLEFADDICLLTQKHTDMEEKLQDLEREAGAVGLKLNAQKTKMMKVNAKSKQKLRVNDEDVEEVEEFTYLGSVTARDGGATADVKMRIQKANAAFIQLYPIWRAREISMETKLRIFQTNVKAVLLYGCETWKVTSEITHKLQVFINRCLRRIKRIFWPKVISNEDLWKQTKEEHIDIQIKRRKWKWIGHTLRKEQNAVERQALFWNPQGQRKRGRPRKSWRRSVMEEAKEEGKTFGELKTLARNRIRWRCFVEALCSAKE